MKRILYILIFTTSAFSLLGQDNSDLVKRMFKDSLINAQSVGSIKLGDNLIETVNRYNLVKDGSDYYLKQNGEKILAIWSKNEKTISGISVFSSEFRTAEGIRVGMQMKDLLSIFPCLKMGYSEWEEEFLVIDKYCAEEKRIMLAYLSSQDGQSLGTYSSFETNDYRINGKVKRIEIYNWN